MMRGTNFRNPVIGICGAVIISLLYALYLRHIFEVTTQFSTLTNLEKMSLLEKEDALFFNFYKTITDENEFLLGIKNLKNYTKIQYPDGIDILTEFHVFPEVAAGFLYHSYKFWILKRNQIPKYCFRFNVDYLHDMFTDKEEPCSSVLDPYAFYLELIWILGAITVLYIYMYGAFLSDHWFGGFYSVVLFIIFHKNYSQIYFRPFARENIAFPFILCQTYTISSYMEINASIKGTQTIKGQDIYFIIKCTVLSTISLLSWRFSSIIFSIQLIVIIATTGYSGKRKSLFNLFLALSQLFGSTMAYYISFENKRYLLGWQIGPAASIVLIEICWRIMRRTSIIFNEYWQQVYIDLGLAFLLQKIFTRSSQLITASKLIYEEDIIQKFLFLNWSLRMRFNFATALFTCDPDYNYIDVDNLFQLFKTIIIKPYCLYGIIILSKFIRKRRLQIVNSEPTTYEIERARDYLLEDFMEVNHLSLADLAKKEVEEELQKCYKILENCKYNYEEFKLEKSKQNDRSLETEQQSFEEGIRNLYTEISLNNSKLYTSDKIEPNNSKPSNIRNSKKNSNTASIEINHKITFFSCCYKCSISLLFVYALIGISTKRFFFLSFTQACVIAPSLCSRFWFKEQRNMFLFISLVVFITSVVDPGWQNIQNEYTSRKLLNSDAIDMYKWINSNTDLNATLGGPVDIINTVHLTTGRSIVNHGDIFIHNMMERTELVYSIYSRQHYNVIFERFSKINIKYLIVSLKDCSNSYKRACDIVRIWDDIDPANQMNPQICSAIGTKSIPNFLKVFTNKSYSILKFFSHSVQINVITSTMPEIDI